ncbi:response regulator [Tepidibacter mesophilus]|uniref:response regulator n=1 Tax=Tepidibacter mesophilus TaxID=655607 RepID=UPI000C0834CE|nr:response regulator [Tepidibacter mesophilus]
MNKKILIVDDEKNIRTTLKYCLQEENYDISIAINGEEGLDKIQSEKFDLVLLDIQMPGLTGMQVLQKVRQQQNKVDVIIMTAYGTVEKAVEAMKLGAVDFIGKPFTPEEIRILVKDVLNRENLNENNLETLKDIVGYSKKCIVEEHYNKAESFLKKALLKEIQSAEIYNLLGVLAESKNEIKEAKNYYRAALIFDPSYEPAQKNLERAVAYKYTKFGINLGDESDDI